MQVERAREGSTVFNPVAVITPFVLDGPETKTVLTIDETTGAKFTFVETDVLGVYPTFPEAGTQVAFEVKSIDTDGVVFNGGGFGLIEDNEYSVYYPFTPDGCETIAQAEAYVQEFPVNYAGQRQTSVDGTFDISAKDYLVAIGVKPENGVCTMNMEHVGALAVMDVTLTGSAKKTYKAVTLSSQTENFIVSGEIDLTSDAEIWNNTGVSTTVSLALGNGTSGLKLKPGNYRFCMMLAPVDMSNETLTLALVDTDDNVYSATVAGRNFKAGKAYKLAATIAGPEATEPTNLSEDGTANTYIVDVNGVNSLGYYFDATKAGNGESFTNTYYTTLSLPASYCYPASGDISGAGVKSIWIENSCITDLAYNSENNTITFKATGNKGNAKVTLTSAANGGGDGVWTWLIWCTDEPQTVAYHNSTTGFDFTVLDRNLGAITSQPSNDLHAQNGFYYQFGSPIPFTKDEFGTFDSGVWRMTDAIALNPHKVFGSGDGFWFNIWGGGNYAKQWFGLFWGGWSTALAGTWGNYAAKPINQIPKTKYDPCPVGYQVAPYSFFNGLALSSTSAGGLGRYVDGTNDKLYFPCNGARSGAASDNGFMWDPDEPNYYIFLWTLNHENSNLSFFWLGGRGGAPSISDTWPARGMGIRCVAEN